MMIMEVGAYAGDLVLIGAVVVLACAGLVSSWAPRLQVRLARRWAKREVGEVTPQLVKELAPVLAARRRMIAFGGLGGVLLALTLILPVWPTLVDSSSLSTVALTGAVVGVLAAVMIEAAQGIVPPPPSGVRVALSVRPRAGWYTSRIGLALIGLAIIVQTYAGCRRVAQVWPYEGGPTTSTVVAICGMIALGLVWIGVLFFMLWLGSRPFRATDELQLRVEVALRRDHFNSLTTLIYPVTIYVGLLISAIDSTRVPVEVRRTDSGWFFGASMLAIFLLLVGYLALIGLSPRAAITMLPPPHVELRPSWKANR